MATVNLPDARAGRGLIPPPMAGPSAPGIAVGASAGGVVVPVGPMPPAEVPHAPQDSLMSGAVLSPSVHAGRPESYRASQISYAKSKTFEPMREIAQGAPARAFGNGGGGTNVAGVRPAAATGLHTRPSVTPPAEHLGTAPAESDAHMDLRAVVDSGSPARQVQAVASSAPHAAHIPRGPVQQIAAAAVQGGPERSFDITLSPAELGKVRITLTPGDTGLSVNIVADRPETLDLLRRHVDQLAQDFREIGYDQAAFSFGSGGKGDAQGGEQAHPAPDSAQAATAHDGDDHRGEDGSTATLTRPAPAGDGRMDIRI